VRDPHKPELLPQPKLGNKPVVKTPELKVLVSLDGSTDAELVLPEVERMVANRAAKIVLVRVERAPDYDSLIDGLEPGTKRALSLEMTNEEGVILGGVGELASHRYLEEVAERFEKVGQTVVCEVGFNNPVDEILFFSDLYHVDLVAMATHGRTGLARLLHGSVTESVLHRAPCPMLVVRKEELAPATLPAESEVAVSAHARATLKPKNSIRPNYLTQ
jgi:nucleotide-binding universal stress UspA family protein